MRSHSLRPAPLMIGPLLHSRSRLRPHDSCRKSLCRHAEREHTQTKTVQKTPAVCSTRERGWATSSTRVLTSLHEQVSSNLSLRSVEVMQNDEIAPLGGITAGHRAAAGYEPETLTLNPIP